MQNNLESYSNRTFQQINRILLPDGFIQTFKHKLDCKWLSANHQLKENFIEWFQDYVDWNEICQFQN